MPQKIKPNKTPFLLLLALTTASLAYPLFHSSHHPPNNNNKDDDNDDNNLTQFHGDDLLLTQGHLSQRSFKKARKQLELIEIDIALLKFQSRN